MKDAIKTWLDKQSAISMPNWMWVALVSWTIIRVVLDWIL